MKCMGFPSREIVERIRRQYAGTKVELVSMNDPYRNMPPGLKGVVKTVDDTGTVFVSWENGSGLGVVYGEDQIKKL
mgnify:FL=1